MRNPTRTRTFNHYPTRRQKVLYVMLWLGVPCFHEHLAGKRHKKNLAKLSKVRSVSSSLRVSSPSKNRPFSSSAPAAASSNTVPTPIVSNAAKSKVCTLARKMLISIHNFFISHSPCDDRNVTKRQMLITIKQMASQKMGKLRMKCQMSSRKQMPTQMTPR